MPLFTCNMYFVIFLLLFVIFVVFFADRHKTMLQTQQKLSAKVSSNGYAEAICSLVYISKVYDRMVCILFIHK